MTGTKTRIVAGDSMVVELKNLPAGRIVAIEADMHSNKDAGAGSMRLTVDGRIYHEIADASYRSDTWAGRYSNVEWDTLRWVRQQPMRTGDVRLVIRASSNSLYLGQLRAEIQPDGDRPYTVSLWDAGTEHEVLQESEIGSGVVLPVAQGGYGWVSQVIERDSVRPASWPDGGRYYPQRNDTLHALYRTEVDIVCPDTLKEPTVGTFAVLEPSKHLWMRTNEGMETMVADSTDYQTWLPADARFSLVEQDGQWYLGGVACSLTEAKDHTWYITRLSDGKVLWARQKEDIFQFGWINAIYVSGQRYLYLFDAKAYPLVEPLTWWTTNPGGVGLRTPSAERTNGWKKIYRDGYIYIIRCDEKNRDMFTVTGVRLH